MSALPMPAGLLLASLCVVFAAGIVRGFAGFGFSALCVAGMSLFMSPAQVVPPIFVLEVLASLSLLRGALQHADWRWLSWLVLGNALCIPLGVALLAYVSETPLRLLIGALLLLAATLLRSGWRLALQPTPALRLTTGLVSGFVNGVAAIGGIAVAVMLSSLGAGARGHARHHDPDVPVHRPVRTGLGRRTAQRRRAGSAAVRTRCSWRCGWPRPCWPASGSASAPSSACRPKPSAARC